MISEIDSDTFLSPLQEENKITVNSKTITPINAKITFFGLCS